MIFTLMGNKQDSFTVALWGLVGFFFFLEGGCGGEWEDYGKYYKYCILRKKFCSHQNKIPLSEINVGMDGIVF